MIYFIFMKQRGITKVKRKQEIQAERVKAASMTP
jgi:hypothetical protein